MKKFSLVFALAMVFSCAAQALQVTDDRGVVVQFDKTPQRIVSLLPSLTETVCELGQCARLVGVDRYSNFPASLRNLPQVGGGLDPNIEAIVALRPDVVLMATSSRASERLRALGLKVVALEPKTLTDVQRVMTTLAQLLNKPDEAKRLWTQIDAAINKQAAALPPAARGLLVYYEVDSAPYAAGTQSFMGEILSRLGARNIVPAELGPFPKLNPEFVVRADPQVIMVGQRSAPGLPQRPGWAGIRAVKNHKLCVWVPAESDMLVRPGPRMAEAAALMARCLSEAASGPVALPASAFKAPPGGMR